MKSLFAPAMLTIVCSTATVAVAADGMTGMVGMTGMAGMAGASQASHYAKQKVVYHVNYYGAKEQTAALRNIQNHINAVGAENLELKVVLHGNGVALLLEPDGLEGTKMKEANATDEMQARISGLKDQGVSFNICANTLKGRKVDTADLYDFSEADIVPSGVAELAHLQAQGYTYIKP
jgi:intracellular sulfur oxidation DsrE/DsrF family protein